MMAAIAIAHHDDVPEDVSPEDQARAAIYGLVSNLFYAAPGRDLLATIAQVGEDIGAQGADSELSRAWRELQRAAAAADESALRQEYDDMFIGTGRARVMLYGSYHMTGFLIEKPVVRLREELANLGFARRLASGENEDHISALCDVMRLLISGGDDNPPASIAIQRSFFTQHIAPWYGKLYAAIREDEGTDFYKTVAAFANSFFDVEAQSFEMA
jgi:TorA maturation chaperone TorD